MAILNIIKVPAEVLRIKAKAVKTVDNEIRTLIDNMVETMRQAPGVGLAAPQVGIPSRIIVVEYGEESEDQEDTSKQLFTLINPEIIKASKETVMGVEGCLSIPNMIGEVERHESITVKALNKFGQPVKIKSEGWLARIFQHEIDHLNGILFTDRAVALSMVENENTEEIEAQQHSSLDEVSN